MFLRRQAVVEGSSAKGSYKKEMGRYRFGRSVLEPRIQGRNSAAIPSTDYHHYHQSTTQSSRLQASISSNSTSPPPLRHHPVGEFATANSTSHGSPSSYPQLHRSCILESCAVLGNIGSKGYKHSNYTRVESVQNRELLKADALFAQWATILYSFNYTRDGSSPLFIHYYMVRISSSRPRYPHCSHVFTPASRC
ncbi:hypothetical protein C5167_043929 [Papaver somniferum]|uniref:Uncharacterized protein n=1 Tax=Papaver somniferum TaxID=3469 RepID=A0A4Y7L9M7_PAPSO|nr:hypothetical protein C5167_043929 [Papaver somniferum]